MKVTIPRNTIATQTVFCAWLESFRLFKELPTVHCAAMERFLMLVLQFVLIVPQVTNVQSMAEETHVLVEILAMEWTAAEFVCKAINAIFV